MAETNKVSLLISLPEDIVARIDDIIENRRPKKQAINIAPTPEELQEAATIREREGTNAANKFLKSCERAKIKAVREKNKVPSRTAVALELLSFAAKSYKSS